MVGAGAANEMVLAVQYRLRNLLDAKGRQNEALELHLISKASRVISSHHPDVSARFERILNDQV